MKSKFDAANELWIVELKIGAIAHLLQATNVEVQPDEMDLHGLGLIVRGLAAEVQKIRHHVEIRNSEFAPNPKSTKRKMNEQS